MPFNPSRYLASTVRRLTSHRWALAIWAAVTIVFFVPALFLASITYHRTHNWSQAAAVVTATEWSRQGYGRRARDSVEISYTYETPGGRGIDTSEFISNADGVKVAPGDEITIHFDPDAPDHSMTHDGLAGLFAFSVLFAAMTAFCAAWTAIALYRRRVPARAGPG